MARTRTIGRASKDAGVKITTIRYYESIGLMPTPDRTVSGQRVYDDAAVRRLAFIRHTRELGFPVPAIRELIELQTQPGNDCEAVDEIARRQLADVRERMRQLRALEKELKRMAAVCAGGEIAACAVMESLSDHENCRVRNHGDLRYSSSPGAGTV
ncbi:MAG: helix-turn-helix domain-containing protein [Euryhalocaulis sp.]|uniref:MerR family transcriptional regulator n=1 Tax=Euryhalocaulis sp. TaxID=2744307 RepID=UPI00179607D2|nr:helix-turn-helix domain-containing protein [Euryhalocaulis sp.]MBA4801434.1 helix-turn-helix domain-containing protein [Euryhalocaulis sp.]